MFGLNEPILEPIARYARFKVALPYIAKTKSIDIVDLGCGPEIRFLRFALKHNIPIKHYYGVDPLISDAVKLPLQNKQIQIVNKPLVKKIALPTSSVDFVVGFAFLEHIDHPQEILNDGLRILKPGGKLILTTPTPLAKTVLEFLAFKLGLISQREIEEHKQYFTKESLEKLLHTKTHIRHLAHHYFEFGLNNILIVTK